jgi:hypothetical protein
MLRPWGFGIAIPVAVWVLLASPGCGGLTSAPSADGGPGPRVARAPAPQAPPGAARGREEPRMRPPTRSRS